MAFLIIALMCIAGIIGCAWCCLIVGSRADDEDERAKLELERSFQNESNKN